MILDNSLVIMLTANCMLLPYYRVLEKIGAKDKIIILMETSQDPGVREHALIAVQKILISDWQRIGKN